MRVNGGDPQALALGYLCQLLGSTLFIDKTGDSASLKVMQLVLNHNLISEYAWCSATLAYLYRQLRMTSHVETKQIGGCLFILHVSAHN